jgi:phosphoribosylformylglycinamidine (FGAM) synthase-like amidotransferase family enzyme
MKFGVIIFPGSNCDHDAYWVISEVAKQPVTFLWHDSPDLQGCDAIIVPGGFAYGDYLRTADWCSESATDFKFCARPDCFPAHCCAMRD